MWPHGPRCLVKSSLFVGIGLNPSAASLSISLGFPGVASGKEPAFNAGDIRDAGSISGSRRSPGGDHGNPLQYSCLENPMDRGTWWAQSQP